MKKLIIPIVLTLIGGGAGVGAKLFLAPSTTSEHESEAHGSHAEAAKADSHSDDGHGGHGAADEGPHYVKIPQQFVVPVIHHGEMKSMVLLSLAIQAPDELRDSITHNQPKLRDNFLRVLFQHANIGGFDGNFTESEPMNILQDALTERAQAVISPDVETVLFLEVARQDI